MLNCVSVCGSAKRRGCGPISGTKGRRSTVMNDVKNVQNSINLLNNLVTAKRLFNVYINFIDFYNLHTIFNSPCITTTTIILPL